MDVGRKVSNEDNGKRVVLGGKKSGLRMRQNCTNNKPGK